MKSPLLLTIECSGFSPRVALFRGIHGPKTEGPPAENAWKPAAVRTCSPEARSAAELMPMIQGLYDELQVSATQTTAIAVTYGPGSFTSLRIGVTTAKMLAFCWRVPAIPVNTLDLHLVAGLMASRAAPASSPQRPASSAQRVVKLWALTNAYRQQYYCKSIVVTSNSWSEMGSHSLAEELSVAESIESKIEAFDSHFDSAFASAETFDGETIDDNAPRFDLNEISIQKQEALFPERYWRVVQATDAMDSELLLKQLNRPSSQAEAIVVVEAKLAGTLQDCLRSAGHNRVTVPSEANLDEAFAWLAWQSLLFLSVDQLHPFRLQPIYYRPSAAEEAWANKI